jgi:phosphatidylglycerophosphate synthase
MAPFVRQLARAGVTPNVVTVASFIVALAGAAAVVTIGPLTGLAIWLVSRVGDGVDGLLARTTGLGSAFGGFLDITLDMAAYSSMVLAFALVFPQHAFAWSAVLAGYAVVVTTTLALSDAARSPGAILGKTERTFLFTRGLAEAGETNVVYAVWALWPDQMHWTIWLWVGALAITCLQRVLVARRVL